MSPAYGGALFRSLCRECLPATFAIGFSTDEMFVVKAGFSSAPAIVLQCDVEISKLDGLVGHSSLCARRVRAIAVSGAIPLLDLALYLDTATDAGFLLQLLWQVAIAMEQNIIYSGLDKGVVLVASSSMSHGTARLPVLLCRSQDARAADDLVAQYRHYEVGEVALLGDGARTSDQHDDVDAAAGESGAGVIQTPRRQTQIRRFVRLRGSSR